MFEYALEHYDASFILKVRHHYGISIREAVARRRIDFECLCAQHLCLLKSHMSRDACAGLLAD